MKFAPPLRLRALAAAFALLLGYVAAPIPLAAQTNARPARQVKRYTIEQFMNTVRVTGAASSPDERSILVSSNKTGTSTSTPCPRRAARRSG